MLKLKLTFLLLICFNLSNAQCFLSGSIGGMNITNTTNNANLDSHIFKEVSKLERFFSQNIDFFFGLEENQSGNAFFTPRCSSISCNGSIVLGQHLILQAFNQGKGLNSVTAVLAHEFAHSVQLFFGWYGNSPLKELHADYLAGFYMAYQSNLTTTDLDNAVDDFYSRGDFNFHSPQHHGTPEERGCAFIMGFKYGRQGNSNVVNAFNVGRKYVIDRNPCYKYKQSAIDQPRFYNSASSDYSFLVFFAMIGILSNDLYYNRIVSLSNNVIDNQIGLKFGYGFSFGLRKEWTRSALEYGISSVKYEPQYIDPYYDKEIKGSVQNISFDLNFIHNILINRAPYPFKPYAGIATRLGSRSGIGAIIGTSVPFLDRFKFDLRYELGFRTNFLRFGLIFKYQKTYLWNK